MHLSNFCCLCLIPNQNLKDILSEDNDGIVVEKKLELFLHELVTFKPYIHKYVCNNCLLNLNHVYKFKLSCLKNMTSLRDYVIKLEAAESNKNIQLQYERYRVEFENQKHSKTNNHEIENVCLQSTVVEETNSNKDYTEETRSTVQNSVNFIEEYNEMNTPENVFIKTEVEEKLETDDSYLSFNEDVQEKSQEDVIVKIENQDPFENFQAPYESFQEFSEENYVAEEVTNADNTMSQSQDEEMEEAPRKEKEFLLPTKSKEIYEEAYNAYRTWCLKMNIEKTTEDTIMSYFNSHLGGFKCSTLWTKYSMLRSTINLQENVDISKFPSLISFLKSKADGYKPKKSLTLTKEHVDKFLTEAKDEYHLLNKVILIFGISGACKCKELTALLTTNVQDFKTHFLVRLIDTKIKIDRSFIIFPGQSENLNLLEIIRSYIALRSRKTTHDRFFVNFTKNKCTVQPVGVHKIASVPSLVAKFNNVENHALYTGNCFRRTSATLLKGSK